MENVTTSSIFYFTSKLKHLSGHLQKHFWQITFTFYPYIFVQVLTGYGTLYTVIRPVHIGVKGYNVQFNCLNIDKYDVQQTYSLGCLTLSIL